MENQTLDGWEKSSKMAEEYGQKLSGGGGGGGGFLKKKRFFFFFYFFYQKILNFKKKQSDFLPKI